MKNVLHMNFSVDRKNKKIKVERDFDAPMDMVWSAWTESELLDQWWAPKPWKASTKRMDFKAGGYWLYAMVSPEGEKHWSRADFTEIKPMKSFSTFMTFCDENGTIDHHLPTSVWKNHFSENNNATTVQTDITFDSLSDLEKLIEMGFEQGLTSALENLDGILNNSE